jgi:hypothetical protein
MVLVPKAKLAEWRDHIEELQAKVDELGQELTDRELEVAALVARVKELERQKGWYMGVDTGYPANGSAMLLYKFERHGIYARAGAHKDGGYINVGYMGRLK